jgi:hypothetical protein
MTRHDLPFIDQYHPPSGIPVEAIARVCHEANAAYNEVTTGEITLPWDMAGQQQSVIEGVRGILGGNTPEQSHEQWCEFKRKDGWVYGEKKDPVAKTHPCLVPYHELPEVQRRKDHLFSAIVRVLAAGDLRTGANRLRPDLVRALEGRDLITNPDRVLCPLCGLAMSSHFVSHDVVRARAIGWLCPTPDPREKSDHPAPDSPL